MKNKTPDKPKCTTVLRMNIASAKHTITNARLADAQIHHRAHDSTRKAKQLAVCILMPLQIDVSESGDGISFTINRPSGLPGLGVRVFGAGQIRCIGGLQSPEIRIRTAFNGRPRRRGESGGSGMRI